VAIDFHDPAGAGTYSGRTADATWREAVSGLVDVAGADVVDLGCGGGTYVRALADLGAASVVGVDSSAPILERARAEHGSLPGVALQRADAAATGLPDGCADLVLARALVHHLDDLGPTAREVRRILRPGGAWVVQDRTADDVTRPAGPHHVRGLLLELAPQLLEVELARRPERAAVAAALRGAGFTTVGTSSLEEVRRRYADVEDYLAEIASRTGRSILHELDDAALARLVDGLRERLPRGPLVERDRWTLWVARVDDDVRPPPARRR